MNLAADPHPGSALWLESASPAKLLRLTPWIQGLGLDPRLGLLGGHSYAFDCHHWTVN